MLTKQRLDIPLTVKSISDTGEFEGYGSVFGVKDSYSDIIVPGAFQKSLCCSRALCQYHNIVRISDDRHTSACHLLVIFVQVDIRKQWGQWSSLRASLCGFNS